MLGASGEYTFDACGCAAETDLRNACDYPTAQYDSCAETVTEVQPWCRIALPPTDWCTQTTATAP